SVGILNGCFLYSFSCHMPHAQKFADRERGAFLSCFLYSFSCNFYPHAQTRQIESVRKYQFKELALYAFQNLF
ncbi:hypothetical protein RK923_00795, partial [Streptococcus pneumoniae]|nr:hypothetical protein [Streptococcus pneumoniae]MDS3461037.1 hypothetical protein [Streptococcus pneumoniae]MDS4542280.1 hypothetical protein [Streptococcus pneumoniae]MDS4746324.1 hypothetical protein [Streptococcus pneumoniae]MDS4992413.1 hypothetical protein [Streptococcus pneumoniae]